MTIPMSCLKEGHKNETWTIDLEDERATVYGPGCQVMGQWARAEATRRFLLPGPERRRFGIAWDNGSLDFHVEKEELRKLREYMDRTILAAGPDAVAALRRSGIGEALAGGMMLLVGVADSLGSQYLAGSLSGGGHFVVHYGLVGTGVTLLVRGLQRLWQHRRLTRLREAKGSGPFRPSHPAKST